MNAQWLSLQSSRHPGNSSPLHSCPLLTFGIHNVVNVACSTALLNIRGFCSNLVNVFPPVTEWQFKGLLCLGDADTGAMWECPLLIKLDPYKEHSTHVPMHTLGLRKSFSGSGSWSQSFEAIGKVDLDEEVPEEQVAYKSGNAEVSRVDVDERFRYLLCISPDAPTNPVICYMGQYEDLKYNLDDAKGPFRLDLGDTLYAPNITKDAEVSSPLWRAAWQNLFNGCLLHSSATLVHNLGHRLAGYGTYLSTCKNSCNFPWLAHGTALETSVSYCGLLCKLLVFHCILSRCVVGITLMTREAACACWMV